VEGPAGAIAAGRAALARAGGDSSLAARLGLQPAAGGDAVPGGGEASGGGERAAVLTANKPGSVASACVPMLRAHTALLAEHDPASARVESERAVALAREVGVVDVEM